MTRLYLLSLLCFLYTMSMGQTKVAITIDDVPNTGLFKKDQYQSRLLNSLDTLNIPVGIFINEGLIYKTDSVAKNFALLDQWIKRDYTTMGNHTFSHFRYSEAGFENYTRDIEKGEAITRELAKLYEKPLKYFRFTYNDLGKDSLQKHRIEEYLVANQYIITPFTIESSDWIFNYLYEHYLKENKLKEAERVANSYIETSLKYFQYFDSLAVNQYDRNINQIYLCHDNILNADYLPVLTGKLKEQGYEFISLDEALQDRVYQQENHYHKKWGVSWFYRWMTNAKEIQFLMKSEPDIMDIYKEYQEVQKLND